MKKNIQTLFISIILTILLIEVLKESKEVIESVNFSISIWKDNLFPSLFPFLILSFFLTNYGLSELFSELSKPFITNILHLPPSCGFTLIASIISGFPSNSKFIKDQLDRGEIDIQEANYLLSFCYFSSPLFVIGTIGTSFLGNPTLGFLILLSHYLGNMINAFLLRPKNRKSIQRTSIKDGIRNMKKKIERSKSFATVLKEAIINALDTLFLLLGIVTVFLILTTLIMKVAPIPNHFKIGISSILEMTQGVKAASLLTTSTLNKSLLMLAIISFGGLSVHTQILSILNEYKISYQKFLKARILHVLFSCIILFILYGMIIH